MVLLVDVDEKRAQMLAEKYERPFSRKFQLLDGQTIDVTVSIGIPFTLVIRTTSMI